MNLKYFIQKYEILIYFFLFFFVNIELFCDIEEIFFYIDYKSCEVGLFSYDNPKMQFISV